MAGRPSGKPSVHDRVSAEYAAIVKDNRELAQRGRQREAAAIITMKIAGDYGWTDLPRAAQRVYDYIGQARKKVGIEVEEAPVRELCSEELGQIWDAAAVVNAETIRRRASLGEAAFSVHDEVPFGVLLSSDEHLESSGCELSTLKDMASTVANTDGLYAGLHGDIRDNFILSKMMVATFGRKMSPQQALRLADYYFSLFGGKILWVVAGNHDNWEGRVSGMDSLADLVERHAVLYDNSQFSIRLRCSGVTYTLFVRHKWKMNSTYNETHSTKQTLRMGLAPPETDVVVMGDTHQPAIEYWVWAGRRRLAIRTGSAKREDEYAHELGFPEGGFLAPVLIFWPNQRKVLAFPDYREGAEYLTYLRRKQ